MIQGEICRSALTRDGGDVRRAKGLDLAHSGLDIGRLDDRLREERHARTAVAETLAHMRQLLAAGRSLLLQPYLEAVDRDGETAVIHIGGVFSHAIRKGPLLPLGAPSTGALFAPEEITAREPGADELTAAQRVLAALPFGALLYARVDLIRDAAGAPCLLELELTEPSLFIGHAAGSAQRLVAATLARLA